MFYCLANSDLKVSSSLFLGHVKGWHLLQIGDWGYFHEMYLQVDAL